MRISVAIAGFVFCTAALLAETPASDSLAPESDVPDNPGCIDSPSAIAVIVAQLRDNGLDPSDYKIDYAGTTAQRAQGIGMNFYRVTNVKTGKVFRACVAIGFSQSTDDAGI